MRISTSYASTEAFQTGCCPWELSSTNQTAALVHQEQFTGHCPGTMESSISSQRPRVSPGGGGSLPLLYLLLMFPRQHGPREPFRYGTLLSTAIPLDVSVLSAKVPVGVTGRHS